MLYFASLILIAVILIAHLAARDRADALAAAERAALLQRIQDPAAAVEQHAHGDLEPVEPEPPDYDDDRQWWDAKGEPMPTITGRDYEAEQR